ncbi:MAG: DEAD/DEAH box helicase, partial [Rhodospirillaceae bacterium]|nr:DEAD/DEAH box helicase [Rhodospirillaceae bacterium]
MAGGEAATRTSRAARREPRAVLRDVFGFDAFRSFQEEAIRHVIGGGNALVLMPTGGGKSLCYQVPALCRPGTAIVVSPLIALMQDQVEALRQRGVSAAAWNS